MQTAVRPKSASKYNQMDKQNVHSPTRALLVMDGATARKAAKWKTFLPIQITSQLLLYALPRDSDAILLQPQ